jgi:N-acetylglutamate synthase-like GNAT family acetyltransferase
MTARFRKAVNEDADAITRLVNSAYRGESSKRGWTTEADLLGGQRTDPDSIREMVRSSQTAILLMESVTGDLLGCVSLTRESSETCYLGMLTIDPALQTAGLGKQLLAHAEETASQWGHQIMRMRVIDSRSELISFYERRGYALTGRTEPFPVGDPRFGLPKVEDLTFVELKKTLR